MDMLTPELRSARMRLVRSANTGPELALRRLLTSIGFRYRLQGRAVPGRPDVVNARRRVAIFLHGCFWHRHECVSGARVPKSRVAFWEAKFARNVERDRKVQELLRVAGWRSLVVWECELRSPERLVLKLKRFLNA